METLINALKSRVKRDGLDSLPLLGMLATWMANQNIAVFNDALRPIALEHKEGRTSKSSLALTSLPLASAT